MVSDNGKPEWVAMRFRITGVESKRPDKVNKYHSRIVGKRCGIEYLGPGSACWLWIECLRDHEKYTRYHTSPVWGTRGDAGVLIIETAYSVYTLSRNEEGE